jgi:hypothetical protein
MYTRHTSGLYGHETIAQLLTALPGCGYMHQMRLTVGICIQSRVVLVVYCWCGWCAFGFQKHTTLQHRFSARDVFAGQSHVQGAWCKHEVRIQLVNPEVP